MEYLLKRLGIAHLKTLAYHPQTDAKCERVHFSVHNVITKLVNDKQEKWPGAKFTDIVLRFILRHVIRSSYDRS